MQVRVNDLKVEPVDGSGSGRGGVEDGRWRVRQIEKLRKWEWKVGNEERD